MRGRLDRAIEGVALAVNAVLAVAGLWLELRPKMRSDAWTGSVLLMVSLLNVAAIRLAGGDHHRAGLWRRARRIALTANLVLVAASLLFAAAVVRHGGATAIEVAGAAGLVLAPLLTAAAILSSPGEPGSG